MDSINKNQEEQNHKDLSGSEAIKKLQALVKKATVCFFCTELHSSEGFATRPMSVQKIDEEGNLWFLSAVDSNKNEQLQINSTVQLLFQGSDYSDFLNIYGTAVITTDEQKIKELWEPIVKTWFTEGENDPRITVIKVVPEQGYYWDTKHGAMVALFKRLVGAAMGKTMDDSIEGNINL